MPTIPSPGKPSPAQEPDPRTVIADPVWEAAMRAKANDVWTTLNTLDVQPSSITFTIEGIVVRCSWDANDAQFEINDGMYQLHMPLAWITSAP